MTTAAEQQFAFTEGVGLVDPGSVILFRSGEVLPAAAGFGPFPLAGAPFLRVFVAGPAGANRARVTINWWADEEMTKGMGADVVTTPTGGNSARQSYPVRGAWVSFVAEANVYPATIDLHVFLTAQATSDNTGSNGTNHLLTVDGTAVGAGATSTTDANSTRGGPGFWNAGFDGATAAGLIRLYMVNMAGGTTLLDFSGPDMATNGGGRAIVIPAMPLRIVAFNGGAAPRNLYASVSYRLPPL